MTPPLDLSTESRCIPFSGAVSKCVSLAAREVILRLTRSRYLDFVNANQGRAFSPYISLDMRWFRRTKPNNSPVLIADALGIGHRIEASNGEALSSLADELDNQFHRFRAKVPHALVVVTRRRVFGTHEFSTLRFNDHVYSLSETLLTCACSSVYGLRLDPLPPASDRRVCTPRWSRVWHCAA